MTDSNRNDEIVLLRAELERQQQQLAGVMALIDGRNDPIDQDHDEQAVRVERTDRRGLFKVAGAAALGATVLGLADAHPAAADDGDSVILGEPNTSLYTTTLTCAGQNGITGITQTVGWAGVSGTDDSGEESFGVFGSSPMGWGVWGTSGETSGLYDQPAGVAGDSTTVVGVSGASSASNGVIGLTSADAQSGVYGEDTSATGGYGVTGTSTNGTGVAATSATAGRSGAYCADLSETGGYGVTGLTVSGIGVYGTLDAGQSGLLGETKAAVLGDSMSTAGVLGLSSSENGVLGQTSADGKSGVAGADSSATGGNGISGTSINGYGLTGQGGRAPIWLAPSSSAGAPATGAHVLGELFVDKNGVLYRCALAGSPGTWIPMHSVVPLATPIRLLDTRKGATAATAPGAPVSGGTTFTLQVTGKSVGGVEIPAGAVAVIGNITVLNGIGNGYLTAFPAGSSTPTASTVNFHSTESLANGASVALSTTGALDLFVSTTTDVIFDASEFIF